MSIAAAPLQILRIYLIVSLLVVSTSARLQAQTKAENTAANSVSTGSLPLMNKEVYGAITQFYEYDRNIPLGALIVEKKELDERLREKIVFTNIASCRVPAYLVFPKNKATPYPVVLLIDGITSSKES